MRTKDVGARVTLKLVTGLFEWSTESTKMVSYFGGEEASLFRRVWCTFIFVICVVLFGLHFCYCWLCLKFTLRKLN